MEYVNFWKTLIDMTEFSLLWLLDVKLEFELSHHLLSTLKIYFWLNSQVLADILPKETLVWKLKMLKSASAYAHSRLYAIKAQTLILCRFILWHCTSHICHRLIIWNLVYFVHFYHLCFYLLAKLTHSNWSESG